MHEFMRLRADVCTSVAALALSLCCVGVTVAAPDETRRATGSGASPTQAAQWGVAAANPLAAQAGMKILRGGGSAVDAAVAIQAVLGLVEPQSSGLGGGAFMVYYDAKRRAVRAYEGREAAPAGAGPDWFLEHGSVLSFRDAVLSGHSTGVPGAVAMLGLAHARHGRLAWRKLFDDATRLAEQGFIVSPRLSRFIASTVYPQGNTDDARHYFVKPDGSRYQAGDLLRNQAYAQTLKRIAWGGARALYTGRIARDIVARLAQVPRPSTMSLADLASYHAQELPAICMPYHALRVCTTPPPSSGVSLLQALALLEHTDIATRSAKDPKAWLQLSEAQRLMYADRDAYVADPAFVSVPVAGLLDRAYIAQRAALIGEHAAAAVAAGVPPKAEPHASDRTQEAAGTSHFIVVDHDGNVVSMTTTVESVFGSGRMVDGFFLNNQLTDFSFSPQRAVGQPIANAVGPRKRPRSSMAPVIVFDAQGRLLEAVGSPGGPAILAYNLKTLIATLDWDMPMQEAIDLPNLMARPDAVFGEVDAFDPLLLHSLADLGVKVKSARGEASGIQGLRRWPDGHLSGGADKRREGVVLINE